MTPDPTTGAWMCLAAAALWAVAVSLFREPIARFGAQAVNLAKCCVAAVLQLATVAIAGEAAQLGSAPPQALAALAASGFVGLVVGDTALFSAVHRLGVHRTLLLQTLAPAFTAALAALWLGELPTRNEGLGAATILCGIGLVVAPSKRRMEAPWPAIGLALGILAAFGQGAGIVLAKAGTATIDPRPASALRLAAAAAGLLLVAAVQRRLRRRLTLFGHPSFGRRVLPATLIGTYFAMFLLIFGVAWARASVAAVLVATTPVFSLLLEWAVQRRRPSARALTGTALAVVGVGLLAGG